MKKKWQSKIYKIKLKNNIQADIILWYSIYQSYNIQPLFCLLLLNYLYVLFFRFHFCQKQNISLELKGEFKNIYKKYNSFYFDILFTVYIKISNSNFFVFRLFFYII